MRRLALVIPVLLFAPEASAISRYDTDTMSCARVTAALKADGAAILRYRAPDNPSLTIYDHYVRDGSFCSASQRATPESVPSADRKSCPVRKCTRASSGGNR